MSGREQDPDGAFLPSIDRDLIRDLDRHLRNATAIEPAPRPQQPAAPPAAEKRPAASRVDAAGRPRTSDILEAVGHAAASMTAMNTRIQELESKQFELAATNNQLRTKLGDILQSQQTADARLRAETDRADRAEEIAARHLSRCQMLEGDLATALADLNRIAEAITGTLGGSGAAATATRRA
jgi:hypothetical protein